MSTITTLVIPNLVYFKIVTTFVSELVLFLFKTIQVLFSLARNFTNNNTPSLPLFDAHLEGFFFYIHE